MFNQYKIEFDMGDTHQYRILKETFPLTWEEVSDIDDEGIITPIRFFSKAATIAKIQELIEEDIPHTTIEDNWVFAGIFGPADFTNEEDTDET